MQKTLHCLIKDKTTIYFKTGHEPQFSLTAGGVLSSHNAECFTKLPAYIAMAGDAENTEGYAERCCHLTVHPKARVSCPIASLIGVADEITLIRKTRLMPGNHNFWNRSR